MEDKKELKLALEEDYIEYWTNKGAMEASQTEQFKKISKEKEEKLNMIVELTVPWLRKAVSQLIDDVKSLENARSSIEMDNTVKLIYNDSKKNNFI